MKLLRSAFIAFYVSSNIVSEAFSPQISFPSKPSSSISTRNSKSRLFVGIHEQPQSQISEDEIRKEQLFIQVVREVNMVKEYLDWLIDESSSSSHDDKVVEATAPQVEAPAVVAAASSSDDVGLFGGGGDVIPPTTSSSPTSTTDSNTETFTYQPSLRTNLGSTILLSGTVDPTLLSILNNNFFGQDLVPNFEFTTIKALVKDVGKAKKGAISREARYGGLLDKLVIEEKSSSNDDDDDVLPTMEELEGVSSWIVQLSLANDISTKLSQIGKLAKESSSVTNVVVLVEGMSCTLNTVDGWEKVLEDSSNSNNGEEEENYKCTLLAVGELYDGVNDGGYYHIGPLDKSGIENNMDNKVDIIDAPKLSKKKAYQLLAHSLSLDSTVSQSLIAYEYPSVALNAITQPYAEGEFVNRDEEGNEKEDTYKNVKMEGRMIQAMREMGFTQYMELDVLVGKGLEVSLVCLVLYIFYQV